MVNNILSNNKFDEGKAGIISIKKWFNKVNGKYM